MFKFGKKSLSRLIGIHPELSFVAYEAIKITTVDFSVFDGVRSIKEQEELVKNGASWTLDSYHLRGLAIDLVPWINGRNRWEEESCIHINNAIQIVTNAHGIDSIEWGYDLWEKDMPHYQMTNYKNKYDIRKLNSKHCL